MFNICSLHKYVNKTLFGSNIDKDPISVSNQKYNNNYTKKIIYKHMS